MHTNYRKRRPPYGFHFYDPAAAARLERLSRGIKDLLDKEGYRAVIPSTVDYPETFHAYESFDSFHLRDSRGEDLLLRSDATAQVIKGYANLMERSALQNGDSTDQSPENSEQKFYYLMPVFRDARKSYPHLREIYQLGVETIGHRSEESIPMLVDLAHRVLRDICDHEHIILLGDVAVYRTLEAHISHESLRDVLIRRDAPELAGLFTAHAATQANWSPEAAGRLARALLYSVTALEAPEWDKLWGAICSEAENNVQKEFLADMEESMKQSRGLAEELRQNSIPLRWEPLLIRKVDYYSGIIFEGFLKDISMPALRGGAYDHLVEKYRPESASAAGFALDISAFLL